MNREELIDWAKEVFKNIKPISLNGHWNSGFALDYHTSSSKPIKDDKDNVIKWETTRPPLGEAVYRLKYWKEKEHTIKIALIASAFLNSKLKNGDWNIDVIIPIPPSDLTREFQPVYELAKVIGQYLKIPINISVLKKTKATSQLKEIDNPNERKEILKDAFSIDFNSLSGKNVLIFDDLYRSGETLNAVCDVIKNKGKAKSVYALTITKTRTKR